MHILSPETDNCPSWISGRERMTVENISWSISTKECCRPLRVRGLNPRPPGLQSDAHPTEPLRPAPWGKYCNFGKELFPTKILMFFLFLHKNIYCEHSLEMPYWGPSNEHLQCIYSWWTLLATHPAVFRTMTGSTIYCIIKNLTHVQLNPDIPCLCKWCRSRWVGLIRICTVCR